MYRSTENTFWGKIKMHKLDEVSGLRLEGRGDLGYIKCWSFQSFPEPVLLDPSLTFVLLHLIFTKPYNIGIIFTVL